MILTELTLYQRLTFWLFNAKCILSSFIQINSIDVKIPWTSQKLLPYWKSSPIHLPVRWAKRTWLRPTLRPTRAQTPNCQWPQSNNWCCPKIWHWSTQKGTQSLNQPTRKPANSRTRQPVRPIWKYHWKYQWFIRDCALKTEATGSYFRHPRSKNERKICRVKNLIWRIFQRDYL